MSFVTTQPEALAAAAGKLQGIGSTLSAQNAAAAAPTTGVITAAADEVSTGIAHLFSQHAANYQALATQAAAFNDQFVQRLTAGAFSYASIEAAIASFLQGVNVNAEQALNSLSLEVTQVIEPIVGLLLIASVVAIILTVYELTALQEYLTTGQILTLSAFLSSFSIFI